MQECIADLGPRMGVGGSKGLRRVGGRLDRGKGDKYLKVGASEKGKQGGGMEPRSWRQEMKI